LKNILLTNSRGISALFLIIAMMLMITIGYIFSYLIPMKQKSVILPIYSSQAFFIAQSGVEFAVRYAADQGWRGATDNGIFDLDRLDNIQRNLVLGKVNARFTINYDNSQDTLTSAGVIPNASERRTLSVSRFTRFLRLVFVTSPLPYRNPYWSTGTSRAQFYVENVRTTNVILNAFFASWTQNTPQRTISRIYIGDTQIYQGTYDSGSGKVNFNRPAHGPFTYTMSPGTVNLVEIRWDKNVTNGRNILITFYTAAGDGYTFNLDSAGNGL
jgi:hypothetical protein